MKPKCKLCGSAHWTYEEHKITSASEGARKVGAGVLGHEKRIPVFPDPNPPESVTTVTKSSVLRMGGRESSAVEKGMGTASVAVALVPKTDTSAAEPSRSPCNACNKPLHNRGKVCNACRQRAYRERRA